MGKMLLGFVLCLLLVLGGYQFRHFYSMNSRSAPPESAANNSETDLNEKKNIIQAEMNRLAAELQGKPDSSSLDPTEKAKFMQYAQLRSILKQIEEEQTKVQQAESDEKVRNIIAQTSSQLKEQEKAIRQKSYNSNSENAEQDFNLLSAAERSAITREINGSSVQSSSHSILVDRKQSPDITSVRQTPNYSTEKPVPGQRPVTDMAEALRQIPGVRVQRSR